MGISFKLTLIACMFALCDLTNYVCYPPVALFSVVNKILEKIIGARLTEHLNKRKMICSRQFRFQRNHSAADLHLLTSAWSSTLNRGQSTDVESLD